jgi:predicted RecA/RadA family phage recombinase
MATNRRFAEGAPLSVIVPSPTKSNDPIILGSLGGVALTDYNAVTGKATVAFEGVWDLSVKAVNSSGNSAVAAGDEIYYVSGDTPPLSKKTAGGGVFFGHALEAVTGGATDTIMVRLQPSKR